MGTKKVGILSSPQKRTVAIISHNILIDERKSNFVTHSCIYRLRDSIVFNLIIKELIFASFTEEYYA